MQCNFFFGKYSCLALVKLCKLSACCMIFIRSHELLKVYPKSAQTCKAGSNLSQEKFVGKANYKVGFIICHKLSVQSSTEKQNFSLLRTWANNKEM